MSATERRNWILIAFYSVAGLFMLAIASVELYGRWSLDGGVATATATITDRELKPCSSVRCGPPFRLKYRFDTPDGHGPFVHTGHELLFERWVRVPKQIWKEAESRGAITVRYALNDLRVNEPVGKSHYSTVNGWGLMIFGGLGFVGAVTVFRAGGRAS